MSDLAAAEKIKQIDASFKAQMDHSKKVWATRGREAQMAVHNARPKTWRNLKGIQLMVHECGHVGNRPFVWGLATVSIGCFLWQSTFDDKMKADSDYWQAFHAKGGGH
eukprot:CAMPEP_0202443364 /NCGR_PEP_ID=MMETSP1360-20130828/2655_1 /ASSEMBLY_ACC=CAM_ASM_000848 /TAXON_ID=515479 /ORGANISM="Licmophora paradoxa, Strain CCMP2313" /LENGTH=107 /DNA_ID=CAMNT_0049059039 /DNA_START=966 /DNA_END=1289 /DNA_ORIENTATION=+